MVFKRIEFSFFVGSLVLALAPVWLAGTFFVTGDGPCHSYNASVLLDWIFGRHVDFYRQFYTINPYFEPNWWTHGGLMLLQSLFTPVLAEKVFLSFYVLAFGFGLRFLLRQLNPSSVFLSSVGMLFCWHHLLQMGFFNYAWSIAAMFWLLGYWLKTGSKTSWKEGVVLGLLWLAVYSMHPVGLLFSFLAVGSSIISEAYARFLSEGLKPAAIRLANRALFCLLAALPALFFSLNYLSRKNWNQGGNAQSLKGIVSDLSTLTALININRAEHALVNVVVFLLVGIVIVAIYSRWKAGKRVKGDFWIPFFAVALGLYLHQVGEQSLELLMPLRLQLFPWLALFFWLATAEYSHRIRLTIGVISIALQTALLAMRLPAHRAASDLVEEWVSLAPQIEEHSVVMVLNYNFNGTDAEGRQIGDNIWMFNHAADYIGAMRPGIIMSDNYEALHRYFPLIWHPEGNLYTNTSVDGIGFEDRPPQVDLLGFPKRSAGRQIKYVLTLDQTEGDRQHERGKEIMEQLSVAYQQVAVSRGGRAVLYRLK